MRSSLRRISRRCSSPWRSRPTAAAWRPADKVGHIVVWDVESGSSLATLEAPELYTWDPVQRRHSIGGIRSLAFSADGKFLAAGGSGRISNIDHLDGKARVEVFDWQKGERVHTFASDKFKGLVENLTFQPQGDWLLAAGGGDRDGFLMFFDVAAKKTLAQEKTPMYVHDLALNEERRHDLCRRASQDGGVWDEGMTAAPSLAPLTKGPALGPSKGGHGG